MTKTSKRCDTDLKKVIDFALEHGILDMDDVQNQMTKKHREQLLAKHPYDIWQGTDSRFRTYIEDSTKKSGRKMIVKTHEKDLLDFLVSLYEAEEESKLVQSFSLEKLYPEWIKYKSLHTTAQNYIRRINNDWDKYYLDTSIIKVPIRNLDKLALDTWAHTLIQKYSMTKKQYYNSTIIMRQALDYAVDRKIITENPFSSVHIDGKHLFQKEKKKPDHTQVFLKDELPAIQSMAWEDFSNNDRLTHKLSPLAILFQFQTGLRLGELCALQYDDLEAANSIRIQRMYRYETNEVVEHTKTDYGDRSVFLTEKAQKYIHDARAYQKKNGVHSKYIFSINGSPLSPWAVENLYQKYCKHLGIINKSSHKSRKTYISALLDGRVNLNTVREMVGHADERTTLKNYCFDRSTETEKINLIERALA